MSAVEGDLLVTVNQLPIPGQEPLLFTGSSLNQGPLPAIFYFALTAEESLSLDPFNQPVQYLSDKPLRIFSMTLPGHGLDLPATQAIAYWAEHLANNNDILSSFITQAKNAVDYLISEKITIPGKIGVAGVSRGAFIASHLALQSDHIPYICGFAPVTDLALSEEFQNLQNNPLIHKLKITDQLSDKTVLYTIGNRDTRVSTRACFDVIEKTTERAYEKGERSPPIELIIHPSIGRFGHGTPEKIFHQGAEWLWDHLK